MPPPTTYDDLKSQISQRYGELSGRLRQVAEFALHHPDDVALATVATIAERAGVQPSTIVRFANAFGFDGFSDMQEIFQDRLVAGSRSYRERIDAMRAPGAVGGSQPGSPGDVLAQFVEDGIVALQHLRETTRPADLSRALGVLESAGNIFISAQGRAFPVAFYLYYALSRLGLRAHLLDGVGGMLHEEARTALQDDVLVAVSFKEYSPGVVAIAAEAAARGVRVIAFTDSPLSPLAPPATVCFEIDQSSALPFRSLVAPLCLAQSLVVALGHQLAAKGD